MDKKEVIELLKQLSLDIKIDRARYGLTGYIKLELKLEGKIIDEVLISGDDVKSIIGE